MSRTRVRCRRRQSCLSCPAGRVDGLLDGRRSLSSADVRRAPSAVVDTPSLSPRVACCLPELPRGERTARMHTCIHAHMHTCIHAYVHTCMHACVHTCIRAYVHAFQSFLVVSALPCFDAVSFDHGCEASITAAHHPIPPLRPSPLPCPPLPSPPLPSPLLPAHTHGARRSVSPVVSHVHTKCETSAHVHTTLTPCRVSARTS